MNNDSEYIKMVIGELKFMSEDLERYSRDEDFASVRSELSAAVSSLDYAALVLMKQYPDSVDPKP